jgi:hypothetical protein
MAEAICIIGLVASTLQLARMSTQLLRKLNNYREASAEAAHIADEIEPLPRILENLRMEFNQEPRGYSRAWEEDLNRVVKGFSANLVELEAAIDSVLGQGLAGSVTLLLRGQDVQLPLRRLESFKSTLTLMISALTYQKVLAFIR